jgi:Domain of unknown function (DUF4082)/Bacterial Ig-like domain
MGMKRFVAALAAPVLAAFVVVLAPVSQAEGQGEPRGLWSTSFSPGQTASDCGRFRLDANAFCVANETRNGLEVGVKFETSRELLISGVRIYRADTDAVTASLWDSGGTLLATGRFPAGPGHTWQDLSFDAPVMIEPGQTYVASYFTPQTKYAFAYDYFARSALTVGPITALRSVDGSPNGVYCYDDAECGSFPVRGHLSSTYWVTPLWQDPGPDPTATPTATPTGTPTATPTPPPVDRKPPRVTAVSPAKGTARVKVAKPVKATFSEPVRRASLKRSTVLLMRKGSSKPVAVRLTYDAARQRVVLHPRTRLRHATTYRVVITTRVHDTAGNRLDQDPSRAGQQRASWTFRTG